MKGFNYYISHYILWSIVAISSWAAFFNIEILSFQTSSQVAKMDNTVETLRTVLTQKIQSEAQTVSACAILILFADCTEKSWVTLDNYDKYMAVKLVSQGTHLSYMGVRCYLGDRKEGGREGRKTYYTFKERGCIKLQVF